MDMELEPELRMNANVRLRLNVMAMVIYELGEVCGVNLEDSLERGLIEKDVIERIRIWFGGTDDKGEPCRYACVKITIDWAKFEMVVEAEGDDTVPFEGLDFSNGYCQALDPRMLRTLKKFVSDLRKKYNVTNVSCRFDYRDKYTNDAGTYSDTCKYMNHVRSPLEKKVDNPEFNKSLTTALNGLSGVLNITLEYD